MAETTNHHDASLAALALIEAFLREDWSAAKYLAANATFGQVGHLVSFAASGWAAAGRDPMEVIATIRAEQLRLGAAETERRFSNPPPTPPTDFDLD
ncbi:MAG TPA: hypothetical protein PLZ93_00495 [Nocardioides sp.]|uniref:hypothetical protein n=1 Tax=uncultured Nocardioides sp. TaxID=198441 RepID=UPI00261633E4|nr:hypothetical protein [uncultured Nocardioides sp.]HRD60456.1 hypothetical protein [Nocardioides sp.]HRI94071.1 hypothetical protein [Nocardioides sp.]HRK44122.1 hypothetical protein [Nocardioides sp.]